MNKFFSLLILSLGLSLFCAPASGQTNTTPRVAPVEIRDASNNPIPLPGLGEKHLLIFYIDPDAQKQNLAWRENLEKNQINSPNIYSYGIVNLKDCLWPNGIVRSVIRSTIKRTGADIYTDPAHLLSTAWNLGDVNDLFTVIFVTKDLEIKFLAKGEMTQGQLDEFDRVIAQYR